MNSYTLTEQMRKTRRKFRLTANEQALYYELIAICNEEGWPDVFQVSNLNLSAALGASEKSIIVWREALVTAGLIVFKSGKSKRESSSYSLNGSNIDCNIYSQSVSQSYSSLTNHLPNGSRNGCKKYSQSVRNTSDIYIGKTKTETKTITNNNEREENFVDERYPWEKPKHERERIPPVAAPPPLTGIDKVEEDCFSSIAWQQELGKFLGLPDLPGVTEWLKRFFEMLRAGDDVKRDLSETKKYARNWIKEQLQKQTNGNGVSKQVNHQSRNKVKTLLNAVEAAKEITRQRYANESIDNQQ